MPQDNEANRLSARARRYARLGANAGAFAARVGVNRLTGGGRDDDARAFASALGSMKGPMMKVAQFLTTIPDALPADYANELIRLQSQAPPMGAGFVRRRMIAELGQTWRERFAEFDFKPAAAASLGQVHKGRTLEGEGLACKLQYPEMASAVETDLSQLDLLFSLHKRIGGAVDTREMAREIRERVREELDYFREAKVARLYGLMLADRPFVRVPRVHEDLSTRRLLTLQWLEGEKLTEFEGAPQAARDAIAVGLFDAWWQPFLRYGVIHGDPHLGNYAVVGKGSGAGQTIEGINLFDYGCVRIFPPRFVQGVVELYRALKANDEAHLREAYAMWGFPKLTRGTFDAMTIWARFICGPTLDDRVRTAADGVSPGEYGRKEIGQAMRALKAEGGGLLIPREFVFLERATIGLGGAFLRLGARLNFHRLYEDAIADFDPEAVGRRQAEALKTVGLTAASRAEAP
ncbi:putative unusual protein kinase regulating ubiquinone biosynthesis (AarF/ABC1/UbiB family) [Roseiarcus fermentans]|uniref:Putative unusual protein kinase regulating ubiquinone biosynthesis (AarF/ABC1/UbiB family) n=1 Tax=Roseiarcus fermentans TaxID=1473586 RepID=A0A366EV78_9HYPH|nr:AarF/UbiB family protein [Roseiarcus fermentans]RBP06303.1 putative unusual protein kinase regulating ubiquinone biosynthesis (AarF/ABC1/UbiB family) [Roseiarcus fermentans]